MTLGPGVGSRPSLRRTGSQRILVAEDDAQTREQVVDAFVEDDHEVFGLESGDDLAECLALVARHFLRAPDLVAVGIPMMRHSDVSALEGLREVGWTTPVVFMTWFAPLHVRRRIVRAGSAVVIAKPFDVAELRSAAAHVCAHVDAHVDE
jgi:DNA-binding response OmpR family regulator